MKTLTRITCIAVLSIWPIVVCAQNKADLQIENFSVYSTLPDQSGMRRVSVSFRVMNRGLVDSSGSLTGVALDDNVRNFITPSLVPGSGVYISHFARTLASTVAVAVRADALHVVPESDETNNERAQVAQLGFEPGRWLSIGPAKIQNGAETLGVGRVTNIAVDPNSPNIIYAGARGSGLWKSNDSGNTWFPIADSLPSAQIDAIGIYPREPEHLVLATPAGVFESKDGGALWTQLTNRDLGAVGSDGGAFLITDAPNPIFYVSTTSGLKLSADGGRSWSTVLRQDSQILSLQFRTGDQTRLFASTTKPPLAFEAKDGGLQPPSWHQLSGCENSFPKFPDDATVWIAQSGNNSWMSFRGTRDGVGIAELWRTSSRTCNNQGFEEHTWEKVDLGTDRRPETVSLGFDCSLYANHFSYLFAHPTDHSLLFKGGVKLCRSERRGEDLTALTGLHDDQHVVAYSRSAPDGPMYFGTDGGIYRSNDKGKTMQFIGEGLNNTEFLKVDTDGSASRLVVGGAQDVGAAAWNGQSAVWASVGGGDSSIVAFDRADLSGIYETAQSTRRITRYQVGSPSLALGDPTLPNCCTYSEFPGKVFDSMVSTGSQPRLLVTCQGIWAGPPWRRIQPSVGVPGKDECDNFIGDFTALKLHPHGILVAVTNTGRIFHGILNQPPLREVFQALTPASPSAISFDGPGRFYISLNTADLGRIDRFDCFIDCTHEAVWSTDLGEITAMTVDPLAANTVIAAVRARGIFRGVRNAPNNWTWTEYNYGLPFGVTVTDLQSGKNGGVIAATYGRGAFQLFSRVPGIRSRQARGHVTSFDTQRANPNRPVGPNNQVTETIELDSQPSFIFTAISPNGRFAGIVQRAMKTKRIVIIEFKPLSASSGTIVTLR